MASRVGNKITLSASVDKEVGDLLAKETERFGFDYLSETVRYIFDQYFKNNRLKVVDGGKK